MIISHVCYFVSCYVAMENVLPEVKEEIKKIKKVFVKIINCVIVTVISETRGKIDG